MKHEEALWSHQGIVRSTKPHLLYCLVYRSWCYLEKTYTTSSFPTCFFFFFAPFKLKGWCSFRRIEIFSLSCISICVGGFSAMSFFFFFFFIRSIWATLLNLSMITFLWKCCLYHCDIFLPTFCQYLVWEVAYYPLYPSFFLFPPLPFGHVMFLSLASGKSSQSGLVFPIGGRVCVHRHLVCASLQCFFVHHLTHNSHIHLFCIDLTPKF